MIEVNGKKLYESSKLVKGAGQDSDLVIGGGPSFKRGSLYMLSGKDAGEESFIKEFAGSPGIDLSLAAATTEIYYFGEVENNFKMTDVTSFRKELNLAGSFFVANFGIGVSWSRDQDGGLLIGITRSFGVGFPFPWILSGNYNEGTMKKTNSLWE